MTAQIMNDKSMTATSSQAQITSRVAAVCVAITVVSVGGVEMLAIGEGIREITAAVV